MFQARELLLLGVSDVQKDIQVAVDKAQKKMEPPANIPTVKQSIGAQVPNHFHVCSIETIETCNVVFICT